MKARIFISFACITLLIGAACSRKSEPVQSATPLVIDLQQEWFPFAGFAGEVTGAKRFAATHGLILRVRPGSEQIDPIKLVLAKTCSVGVVGGDLLVAAIAKGAPLVAIAVVNERSPTVFMASVKSRIVTPADFRGHKVGIMAGTNTERIYDLMMKRLKIDRTQIKEIQIPFDLQTFILGEYDVRPAFIYDETVSMEQKGLAFNIIKPEEFGVNFTGTVYFTSRDYLATHREVLVRLLATLNEGWKFALDNPGEAIRDLVEAYPDLKPDREKRALELGRPYFADRNGRPLTCDPAIWEKMIAGLEELGVIPHGKLKVSDVWDSGPLKEATLNEN